jgi:tetratricopeptide (TPR) repeat protein
MADTTLKAYYAYLDDLLTRRRYDEVAAHAQHILARYPKNLGAWRRLGKAQLENGQFDEALKAFGQVLGFVPQDVDAYVGLSWVYRQRSDADRTIYFLERAYEREPANTEIIGLLRDAYRIFHDRANAKLPNTPYMMARQQLKSGLATQAVKALQDALNETPNRTDLRVLLAEVYAQIGQPVEAAKTAVAVIKELPDCLRANQILAVVWLEAGRPSDAQRLVSRIEEVDPYLAYEIATGETLPDEAFTLPRLNYGSRVGQAVNNASPDWLSDISSEVAPPASVTTEAATPPVPAASQPDLDADWLKAIRPMEADVPSVTEANEDWLAALGEPAEPQETAIRRHTEQWVQSIDPVASVPAEPDADWLVAPQPPPDDPEDTSWLAAFADEPSPAPAAPEPADDDWLHTIEDNINEVADARTISTRPEDLRRQLAEFGFEDAPVTPQPRGGSGVTGLLDALTDDEKAAAEPASDTPHSGVTGLLDALTTEGKVPTESLSHGGSQPADLDPFDFDAFDAAQADDGSAVGLTGLLGQLSGGDEPAEASQGDSGPLEDPFAWMAEEDIELVEPAPDDIRRFREGGMGTGELAPLEPAQDDALAWARDSGVELEGETEEPAMSDEDPFAWLRAEGIEVITDDLLEPSPFDEAPSTVTVEEVMPMSEKDTGQLPAEAAPEPPVPADEAEQTDENNGGLTGLLALMGGGARVTPSDDRQPIGGEMADQNDMPDWLRATGDAGNDGELDVSDGALDWLTGLDGSADADDAVSDELDISALVEDSPAPAAPTPPPDVSDADDLPIPDWMADLKDERDPNELVKVSTVETPAIVEALTVDEADSGFFPTLEADEPAAGGLDTLILDAPLGQESPSSDAADWALLPPPETAAVRPPPTEAAIMPAVTFDPHEDLLLAASLSSMPEVAAPAETPLAFDDEPLVLDNEADLFGEASAAPADALPLFEDEPLVLEDESGLMEADAAGEVDWLSAMASNAPSSHSVIETDEMGTLDDLSAAFDPAPVANSDDFSFGTLDFDDDEPVKQGNDAFSLDFFDTLDEGETSGANTLVLDDDPLPDAILDERGASAMFDFDMDVPANQLNDSGALFGEVLDDGDLLMVDPEPADALSETAVVSAPDWLNALAPGLEVDADAVDSLADDGYLGGARGDYGWLVSLVDEELRPPAAVPMRRGPRFAFDQPPLWLQSIREQTRQIPALKDADDDALPDWLRGIEDDAK